MAFTSLQAPYLKCVFSYSVFFTSLEAVYQRLYAQLNRLNGNPGLRCEHRTPPQRTSYVTKRKIRNLSLAHIGSDHERRSTVAAAMTWVPILTKQASAPWNLDAISFGGLKRTFVDENGQVLEQSDDL